MRLRIYQLFGSRAGYSNANVDLRGDAYYIAAANILEAYRDAYEEKWSLGLHHPAGILEKFVGSGKYQGEHWLWCGCIQSEGVGLMHGDGERHVAAAMQSHLTTTHAFGVQIWRAEVPRVALGPSGSVAGT
ncbi:MAG: hypothetical protein ABWY93_22390 [Mycobacterium sp.]